MEQLLTLDFKPEDFLTVLVIALFVAMAVQAFVKPAMADYKARGGSKYELILNSSAFVIALLLSFLGLVAAGLVKELSVEVLAQTFFRSMSAFFVAVFGYKGYSQLSALISKNTQG
jgi:uncharacterized membrane protein YiaA